jgi:hypothetical protein
MGGYNNGPGVWPLWSHCDGVNAHALYDGAAAAVVLG